MSSDATACTVPSLTSWAHSASASPGAWETKVTCMKRNLQRRKNKHIHYVAGRTWITGTPRYFRSWRHSLVCNDAAVSTEEKHIKIIFPVDHLCSKTTENSSLCAFSAQTYLCPSGLSNSYLPSGLASQAAETTIFNQSQSSVSLLSGSDQIYLHVENIYFRLDSLT